MSACVLESCQVIAASGLLVVSTVVVATAVSQPPVAIIPAVALENDRTGSVQPLKS